MKKGMKKKIISFLLAICTLVTLIPPQVFALQETDRTGPFTDVSVYDWFYEPVKYVHENNIFTGTSESEFTPGGTMTRGMFVTVLGRMAGVDADMYAGESSFDDVDPSAYYAPYVAWAAKYGITTGTGDGKFSPDALINREQMAALYVRYFEIFGVEFGTGTETDTVPADIDQVSEYAREAVLKLWRAGLLNGDGVNFNPRENASRAQTATLCMRIDKAVEVWYREPGVPSDRRKKETQNKSDKSSVSTTYYTFKFDTNGGSSISDRSIRKGDRLDNLPVPYKENAIFVGWCYDRELTQIVSDSDTASRSTVLYAKYEELSPLNEEYLSPVASAVDVGKNFTVKVLAPDNMTIGEFREAIMLKNLSSNEDKDWFRITGGNGVFIISGVNYLGEQGAQQPGFEEGSAYKIILEENSLSFDGQDQSTREYVFTIRREEVVNVSLNSGIKQIPLADISDLTVNGARVQTVSIPVITVGTDGAPAENGVTKGSFTYSRDTLAVGDTIMIYEGNTPPAMDEVSIDENTAFVEVTGVNGTRYTYRTASAENVLFTPDILPVSVDADTDGDADNNSITVPVSSMTYTDDHFALAGLDSQTTIDVGDFISFYSGSLQADGTLSADGAMQGYARITSVQKSGETYIISYQPASLSEVQQSMAAYKKENIASDDLLEGVDRRAIEESVEKQARESGFAEEAGMYLAALALETDSFTLLSDEYELTAVEMSMNGQPITQETIQSMGGVKAEVELSRLQAALSNKLVHFEGLKGLRLTLNVGVKVSIECSDDVTIEIEITGTFEQEVRVDIGVDGDAVWEWWGIFPYIAEYEVTAFAELYEYTGIGVEATIATIETDEEGFGTKNESIESIGKQIKDLMDKKEKYIGDGKKTVSDSLEEKYSDMLENETDWVTLFEKELFDKDFHVLAIIAINVEVKFVVSASLNISLGMDFWYENGKRYVYTIQVFANKVKSDVINLVEEHWEFEFYVMGTMGLRAGIRAGISVGLISTKLASVGFAAEAGAYVRVWGYFYYKLKYTASNGRSSSYSGAIYLEFGVYLEVNFEAQAISGKFSYEYSIYENEWPLLKAGDRDNVRDFAYGQEDAPGIRLKSYITSVQLPDFVFDMAYLDLKEGMEEDENGNRVMSVANYDAPLDDRTGLSKDEQDDEKNFSIIIKNGAFSYDPNTNTVSITPGTNVREEGEMIITWKQRPMEFSSVPIQRKITLYWDNLKDGYIIAPFTNGGSYVPVIIKKYEEEIKAPADPVKKGYIFAGWYSDEALTQPYTFPKTMPNADTSIYAKWEPASDTPYTVEHYRQKLGSSEYELYERETFTGTTDSTVTSLTKSYTGFKTPAQQMLVIRPDGSSVLRYYYDRQTYSVTFNPGEAGGDPVVISLKYGSAISVPQFAARGYIFKGWDKTVSTYMGDHDLTYTALWDKDQNTEYRVEYYVQQPDGRYVLQDIVHRTGITGESIEAEILRRDDIYEVAGVTSFRDVTVNGESRDTAVISGDGKTVIKVNYKRNQYTVTFKPENGDADIIYTLYSGAEIKAPLVNRMGYSLSGWSPEVPADVGTKNLTFTALWNANNGIPYAVKHIRQQLDDNYPSEGELVEYVYMTGTTDEYTAAQAKNYEGFTARSYSQARVAADGSTVVEIRYSRNSYPVNWVVDGTVNTVQVKYGAVIAKPLDPVKQGYVLDRWDGFAEQSAMDTTERTYTAVWKPATDTPYTVKHIRADLKGSYPADGELVEAEKRYGTTGTQTAAVAKAYEGFTAGNIAQAEIKPDGSTEVTIFYDRNTYTVTWVADNRTFAADNVIFGDTVRIPEGIPEKAGYSFEKWLDVPGTMPAGNINIEAVFAPNEYMVGFDMNNGDGPVPEPIYVRYDRAYGKLPVPSYTGYRFERWVDENGRTVTETTIVNIMSNHTLKAVWAAEDAIPYKVMHMQQNVDDDGYTCAETETRYGQTDTDTAAEAKDYEGFAPQANRRGYTFIGWDVNPPATMPDRSLTFTARWTKASYIVSFNGNGGTDTASVTVTYNGRYPAMAESVRAGYTFIGWFTEIQGGVQINEGDIVDITESITLYARWTPNSYRVSFDLNGLVGETPESIEVTYDDTYGVLPEVTATRPGYHFGGWYTAPNGGQEITADTIVKITAPTTLYARPAPNTYRVRFDSNGGRGYMDVQTHTYGQSLALAESRFVNDGYTFSGWNTKADGSGVSYHDRESVMNLAENQDEEVTLFAQWSINSYTVTFNTDGGTAVDAITQIYNTEVEKPADPAKHGYSFAGWMNGTELVTFPLALTNNLNLTAKWEPVEYAINYIGTDGIENINPVSYTIESDAVVLADPGPKTGYTFEGWFTSEDRSEDSKVTGIAIVSGSTGVRTFYAKWQANVYGVNFDDGTESGNAGGSMSAQSFVYDAEQPLKNNEFVNPGYAFAGWGLAPRGTVLYADGENVKNLAPSGSITLYAQWKPITYTISYTLGSGAAGTTNVKSYTIESDDIVLKDPAGIKAGYRFLGWYSGDTAVMSIPRGSTGDVSLRAKWEHGGIFTLEKNQTKNSTTGDVTFTVTRTFPSDAVPTADIQYVYYRTLNGTAIGGTAAPVHFSHVGGDDVFLTFGPGDTKKTFVVKSERNYISNDMVNSFTNGVSRYYDVVLYRASSASQICTGTMGSTVSVRRTLAQSSDYMLSSSFYTTERSKILVSDATTVTDKGYGSNKSISLTPDVYNSVLAGVQSQYIQYIKSAGYKIDFRLNMEVTEDDDGYQLVKVVSGSNSSNYLECKFEIVRDKKSTSWHSFNWPILADQGEIRYTDINCQGISYGHYSNNDILYIRTDPNESYKLQFDAEGSLGDDWKYRNLKLILKIGDPYEPVAEHIVPMAYGTYRKGDTVTIAVEFSEIIGTASNVTLSNISYIPIDSWSYEGGVGTNVLLFKGTLNQDFKVDPNTNIKLAGTVPTVKGTIKDLY